MNIIIVNQNNKTETWNIGDLMFDLAMEGTDVKNVEMTGVTLHFEGTCWVQVHAFTWNGQDERTVWINGQKQDGRMVYHPAS